jgi:hypothetical protein
MKNRLRPPSPFWPPAGAWNEKEGIFRKDKKIVLEAHMTNITKEGLAKIVELVNSVPTEFRQKCFEILLGNTLQTPQLFSMQKDTGTSIQETTQSQIQKSSKPFVLPIDVKAFLTQYKLDESILWKCFLVEGGEIRPLYHLKVTKKATAQIQHALMLCLENALSKGQFSVDIEVLRTRCQENKCYGSDNFIRNLKNNDWLFKGVPTDQPLVLSSDGKAELADLIEQIKD